LLLDSPWAAGLAVFSPIRRQWLKLSLS